ncbi:MAG: hypothetical protein OEZ34_13450 [Spirochaetia bacterium]|nr:hypothetical protein [Spirochaetia bacterium]
MDFYPYGMWDSWAMYNAKAKDYALSYIMGIHPVLIKDFWDAPSYPAGFPVQSAFIAVNVGYWHISIPVIISFIYYLLIVGGIISVLMHLLAYFI